MKEKYIKPRIIVERFTLTQSIAANCAVNASNSTIGTPKSADAHSCVWEVGGFAFFLENSTVNCLNDVGATDDVLNGYCYNNPTPATALFSSF